MKELSTEEKAKLYDEAIEKARIWRNKSGMPKDRQGILDAIFPELKESEDERIRKWIIGVLSTYEHDRDLRNAAIAWLEKQAEHANFRNKIQIGDKVTRNRDGMLVNLSQLNRVAKKDEKQGEQKNEIDIPFGAKDSEFLGANYYIPEGFHAEIKGNRVFIKKGEQNPAWSEEDATHYNRILKELNLQKEMPINVFVAEEVKSDIVWFKDLKDRVQPQPQWKPSERQKEALLWCVVHLGGADKQTLGELLEELNKL